MATQNHHVIPHGEEFDDHPLVKLCGCSLQKDQPLLPLENHTGPHTRVYKDKVKDALDKALRGVPPKRPCEAIADVIKKLASEILSGETDPYEHRGGDSNDPGKTDPIEPDGKPYKPGDKYPLTYPRKTDRNGKPNPLLPYFPPGDNKKPGGKTNPPTIPFPKPHKP